MSSLEGEARMAVAAGDRKTHQARSEIRDGMRIDWDVPITMDDGLVLRADVFRPIAAGRYPVILSYGPYAKGLAFQDGYPSAWQRMAEQHPDVAAGSSNCTRAGKSSIRRSGCRTTMPACASIPAAAGCSPGYIDHFSPRETKDFYECIEWAGVAAVVERQGRPQRHLLLRHQSVARRDACSRRTLPPCASGKAPPTGIAT